MQNLVERLTELLKEKNITLTTAESCTGGLLATALTHQPGASNVFDRGFITYSNQSKMDMLDIPEVPMSSFGAVSAEIAEAMAKGALKNSNAGLSVSITGVAGPDGGTEKKPVGLVYFGYALKGGSSGSVEYRFEGTRTAIQQAAVTTALKHLITVLERPE